MILAAHLMGNMYAILARTTQIEAEKTLPDSAAMVRTTETTEMASPSLSNREVNMSAMLSPQDSCAQIASEASKRVLRVAQSHSPCRMTRTHRAS